MTENNDTPRPPIPYGTPQPPIHHYMVQPTTPTSSYATASLVLGIFGALGGWCMFGLPCILAIVFGHLATRETRTGQRGGHGSAIAGLILGYLCIVPMVLITFWVFSFWAIGSVSEP